MQKTYELDQIICSIFYLMTQYSLNPEIAIADMINKHLALLENHPANDSETIKNVCTKLTAKWQSICNYQFSSQTLIN